MSGSDVEPKCVVPQDSSSDEEAIRGLENLGEKIFEKSYFAINCNNN
jgi:hypothetical protein